MNCTWFVIRWFRVVSGDVTSFARMSFIVMDFSHSSPQRRNTMKHFARHPWSSVALGIAMLVCTSSALSARNPDDVWFKGATVDAIERSLAMALRTPSPGMQASASQIVRDLKTLLPDQDFSLLIIPLMAVVKNEDADVSVRMVAALALYDLRSAKGDFAIERVGRFTHNDRLRHLCSWLSYNRTHERSSALNMTPVLSH